MAGEQVKTATEQNFQAEVVDGQTPALVDFWAPWCGPCKALTPIIDELAEEYAGKLNVFKLNVDDNPNIAAQFGVRGIPTILLFKGGEVAQQQVGVVPKDTLKGFIDQIVG